MVALGTGQMQNNEWMQQISSISGYLSISFWLFAQIPQVIKNHTDKNVDGFSLGFLLCWFGGDLLNLISCLMNDAMLFQTLLSSYYCTIDVILALQFYYYKQMYNNSKSKWYHKLHGNHRRKINSPRQSLRDNLQNYGSIDSNIGAVKDSNKSVKNYIPKVDNNRFRNGNGGGSGVGNNRRLSTCSNTIPHVQGVFKKQPSGISKIVTSVLIAGLSKAESLPLPSPLPLPLQIPIKTLSTPIFNILEGENEKENNSVIYRIFHFLQTLNKNEIGKILAWSCTFLYLVSRIPQIITNYKIKSTKGLSLKLVSFALFGNLFYSLSLLFSKDSISGGEISKKFWESELSYFIGSIGTVIFDFTVILQWYHYDRNENRMNYKRTKSGKLRLVSPKNLKVNKTMSLVDVDINDRQSSDNERNTGTNMNMNINIQNGNNDQFKKMSSPISMNVSRSIKSTLSPSNMKKLNEFTPLSPMDFLLDDYVNQHRHASIDVSAGRAGPAAASMRDGDAPIDAE